MSNWPYGHPDGTAADHAYHAASEAKQVVEDILKRLAALEERVRKLEQARQPLMVRGVSMHDRNSE